MIDLNHGSGPICPRPPTAPTSDAVNAHIDAALVARNRSQTPRDYLGGSRVGEPCERKLVYEVTHTPKDPGADFDGPILRVFDAGHAFEALSIRWLREAGFDLRDQRADGGQFGFETAGGRLRGHIDGVIVAGPPIGVRWPALWEHKALNTKSWSDLVKRGVRLSKPVYFAQLQLYMAYMELGVALFTALNKDSQALYHEIVPVRAGRGAGALRQGGRDHPRRRGRRAAAAHGRAPRTSTSAGCATGRSAAGRPTRAEAVAR